MEANKHLTELRHLLLKEEPEWDKARILLIRWLASEDPGIGVGIDYTMRTLDTLSLITELQAEQIELLQRISKLQHEWDLSRLLIEAFAAGEFSGEVLLEKALEIGLIRAIPVSRYVPGTCPMCGRPDTGGTVCFECRR